MRRPLLALSVAFALGILVTDLFNPPPLAGWLVTGAAAASAAVLALLKIGGPLRFLLWLLALLALGSARGDLPQPPAPPPAQGKLVVSGTARTGWRPGKDLRRLEMDVHAVREAGGDEKRVKGRLRLAVLEGEPCPQVLPGDNLRVLATLRAPRGVQNPGVLDYARLLRRRGIDWTGIAESCRFILLEHGPGPFSILRISDPARAALQRFVASREAPEEARGILTALTVGERGKIPEATGEDFRKAGLAHLLAISGLHLGFVAAGLYFLLVFLLARTRKLVLRLDVRRLAAAVVIPVTLGYTLLAGAHLPAVRFIVLGMPVVSGWLRLPLTRPEEPWWRRFLVRVIHFMLVTLLATLATAPLTAYHFNQLSLMGLVANLAAVPLAAFLIVPLGLVACLLYPFSEALAGFFADSGLFLSSLLSDLAAWFASMDFGWFHVATPAVFVVILLYATMFMVLQIGRLRWARWAVLTGVVLLVGSWGVGKVLPLLSDDLEVTVIDVGQGDSILVRFPGGDTLLIDAGPARDGGFDAGRRIVAPYLWGRGITRLDAVAVTHPQADHVGGMPSVIELFKPKEIWAAEPLERISGARILRAGAQPRPGVFVLWPPRSLEGLQANERSLVLRIVHEKTAFLLTGDLEESGEAGLLDQKDDLQADVLKIGHHGSRRATSENLLGRVRPTHAIISAGVRNPFGFPNPELLERLMDRNIAILRTDRHGAVTVVSDGEKIEVETRLTPDE
jgi:competence protein ComEC